MENNIVLGIVDKDDLKFYLLCAMYPNFKRVALKKMEEELRKNGSIGTNARPIKKRAKEYIEGENLYNNLDIGGESILHRVEPRHVRIRINRLNKKFNTNKEITYDKIGIGVYRFFRKS